MADTEQQVTSKTPTTKQKTQNVSLRAKLSPSERELLVRLSERPSSRLRASLRKQNNRLILLPTLHRLILLPTLHRLILLPTLHQRPKTFSQQHNG